MYRPGKENLKADALTRRDDEIVAQDGIKTEYRTKAFLSQDQIDPRVLQDLGIDCNALDQATHDQDNVLEPIAEAPFEEPVLLLDRLLNANKTCASLNALRPEAEAKEGDLALEDGLLLYNGRLVVPDTANLRTELIKEAHNQVSTAHPGRDKT